MHYLLLTHPSVVCRHFIIITSLGCVMRHSVQQTASASKNASSANKGEISLKTAAQGWAQGGWWWGGTPIVNFELTPHHKIFK